MDCQEAQGHFGTAIDGSLAVSIRTALLEHLGLCKGCRKKFELESITKSIVSRTVAFVQTPPATRSTLLQSLRLEYASASPRQSFADLLRRSLPFPVLSAGAVAIVAFLFILPSNQQEGPLSIHPASNDVITTTLHNFQRVRDGQLKPAMTTCVPEDVADYFEKQGLTFALNIIPVENCEWYGAIAEKAGTLSPAQVVYKVGNDLIYVYEVPTSAAEEGAPLSMPSAARASLLQTGWYTDAHHPPCCVVLWKMDGTLCSAASTMKKEKLVSLLASK